MASAQRMKSVCGDRRAICTRVSLAVVVLSLSVWTGRSGVGSAAIFLDFRTAAGVPIRAFSSFHPRRADAGSHAPQGISQTSSSSQNSTNGTLS